MPFSESPCCAPSRQQLERGEQFRLHMSGKYAFSVKTREGEYICHRSTFETPVLAQVRVLPASRADLGFNSSEQVLLEWAQNGRFQATRVRDGKITMIDDLWRGAIVDILGANPRQRVQELIESAASETETVPLAAPAETQEAELVAV